MPSKWRPPSPAPERLPQPQPILVVIVRAFSAARDSETDEVRNADDDGVADAREAQHITWEIIDGLSH